MTYCRNCGVRLRHFLGRWWHAASLGPVQCAHPEPEEPDAAARTLEQP